MRKMRFQNPETGLVVVVVETAEKQKYEMSDGTNGFITGLKELMTEGGQPCVPVPSDTHDLVEVDCLTDKGTIQLRRLENERNPHVDITKKQVDVIQRPNDTRRGVWVEFASDGRKVVDIIHEPKDATMPDCCVWCEESDSTTGHNFGSSDCSLALDVLQRLRDWAISNRDAFAEQANRLDCDKMHFEADQKWQKYWAFNAVCLWAEEEIREIYAKLHPAEASTFTEHVQRQHGIVRR